MTKIAKSFRFEAIDIQAWQVVANRSGLSLSEWIRRSCNVVEAMEVAPSERTTRPGSIVHASAGDSGPAYKFKEPELGERRLSGGRPTLTKDLLKIDMSTCRHNMMKAACPRCK